MRQVNLRTLTRGKKNSVQLLAKRQDKIVQEIVATTYTPSFLLSFQHPDTKNPLIDLPTNQQEAIHNKQTLHTRRNLLIVLVMAVIKLSLHTVHKTSLWRLTINERDEIINGLKEWTFVIDKHNFKSIQETTAHLLWTERWTIGDKVPPIPPP